MSTQRYQTIVARNRAAATPAELAAAEQLRDAPALGCDRCGGSRFVLVTAPGSLVHRPAPCECLPLEARAAIAGIPPRYRAATLEAFRSLPGKERARAWCEGWDGRSSVVLVGAQWGTGKTHLGAALLLRALEIGRPARFVHVPDFLEELKARFDVPADQEQAAAYFGRIATEPLLMLDDLGQERATPWTQGELRRLFNHRWARGLTTIVTTNCTSEAEIAAHLGGAVASRLREATWLTVAGADMRGVTG